MEDPDRAALDLFGRALMERVRGTSFAQLQRVISGRMKDEDSIADFEAYRRMDAECKNVLHRMIARAADLSIAEFLYFIEQSDVELMAVGPDGRKVNLKEVSDGLVGELFSDEGWVARYSQFADSIEPI